jgi:Kef-type K+ transport system membrane component KefB
VSVPLAIEAPSGVAFEFLVVFAVILIGPIVVSRLGLPGLIGLVVGGFAIGPHGLNLVHAGNSTVPELGHLGLLYLMFVAGLELDLQVLRDHRRSALALGLLAFTIPVLGASGLGFALGWSLPATALLGALLASHTLIVYPTLRNAGLGANPSVASAVGATVLTDTLALVVLAVVAGSQTNGGSPASIIGSIVLGFVVIVVVALLVLPRVVDLELRYWGADPVARYVAIFVALLFMATLAQVFGIEGIVGAFFAGLALNTLVPNEGPSMERLEFFGNAIFVPIFLVSIGLLIDPAVMFRANVLVLAGLIIAVALGGKAAACWIAGALRHATPAERLAMFVLTAPQAAATLAVTLVGYQLGLFGTSLVNAVLVLILVSIAVSAVLAEQVIKLVPVRGMHAARIGEKVVIIAPASGPSEAAVRTASLLARPDGGHGEVILSRSLTEPAHELKAVHRQVVRQGLDGRVRAEIGDVQSIVERELLTDDQASVLIVDDPSFANAPARLPVIVVDESSTTLRVNVDGDVADEIARRLRRATGASADALEPGRTV